MPDQPSPPENWVHISVALRDYFAAMAMQGIIIGEKADTVGQLSAAHAYRIADLMLAAREKVAS